jgi:hypothetical protein
LHHQQVLQLALVDLEVDGGSEGGGKGRVGDERVRCGLLRRPALKGIQNEKPLQEVQKALSPLHLVHLLLV